MGARLKAAAGVVLPVVQTPLALLIAFDVSVVVLFAVGSVHFDPRLAVTPELSVNQLFLPGAAAVIALALLRTRGNAAVASSACGALLVALLAVSYLWSPATEYGWNKLVHFATFWALAWSWAALSAGDRSGATRVLLLFGGVGIALGLAGIGAFALSGWSGRLAVFGGGPNVFSRWVAMGLIVLAALSQRLSPSWRRVATPPLLAALAALGLALLLANSKGSLLGAFVAGAFLFVRSTPRWSRGRRVSVGLAALLGIGGLAYVLEPSVFARLILSPGDIQSAGSYGARAEYLMQSVDLIRAGPVLGTGVGGWAMEVFATDTKRYPHNLVVEVLAELGPILGGVFLLALTHLVVGSWRAVGGRDPVSTAIKAIVLFASVVVLFSGDLVDSRILIFAIVLLDRARDWSPGPGPGEESVTGCA